MSLKLIVATTNLGKLRDFALAAEQGDVQLLPLPGMDAISAPEEDQDTFEGNAKLKAIYYSQFAPGQIVLADDSGLEVDALNGAPGVRSARYADDAGLFAGSMVSQDERNNRCLMEALRNVTEHARWARYRCVLAAARDGKMVALGSGAVEGKIALGPRGTGGFGYDPYFVPDEMDLTMAELAPEVRLSLSHRGRALRDLLPKLLRS